MRSLFSVMAATAAILAPMAAGAAGGYEVLDQKVGPWAIYIEQDMVTDQKRCVALYEDRFSTQLSIHNMALSFRRLGGLENYSYRLDDRQDMKLNFASRIEKDVGVVFFDGERFEELLGASRLRLRAVTMNKATVEFDINLADMRNAVAAMRKAGCQR